MPDENKNKSPISGVKTDPKLIKKLESDLKAAFKENRFDDLKKIADEIKKVDSGNHLANRILAKMESMKAESIRVVNAAKIKLLEGHMQDAFKSGRLMDLAKIASEIKKMDPENKSVKKIETRIEKAKAVLDAQIKKEKIRGLEIVIKEYLKGEKWDEVTKKANELLLLDKDNGLALKALKVVGKTKKIDYKKLMTSGASDSKIKTEESPKATISLEKKAEIKKPEVVMPSVKKEAVAKPGFFSRLFKKKEAKPEIKAKEVPAKAVSVVSSPAIQEKPVIMPVKAVDIKPSVIETPKLVAPSAQMPKAAVITEKKPGFLSKMFKKQEVKEVKPEISKKEALSKAISEIMTPVVSSPVIQEKPVIMPVKAAVETKPPIVEMPKAVMPVTPVETSKAVMPVASAVQESKPSIFKSIIPVKAPVTAFKPQIAKVEPKAHEAEKIVTVPLSSIQSPSQAKAVKPVIAQEAQNGKGNIFTKLFSKNVEAEKPTESIIETIVAQSSQATRLKKETREKEESTGESFLRFSNLFLKFSVAFIIISAGFFYSYNIDANNTVFSLLGQENNAIQLKSAASTLADKQTEKDSLSKEIDKYKKGYQNDYKTTIDKIVANRMDWPNLIAKLNEVTESVYEKNALAQYVQYNNYSYDATTGQLTVSATLSDPLGKNLTKLAELEDAFTYYPKDKNDPNDTRKPYFYGFQGFHSYAKSFNKATGRYISNFSLSLSTRPEAATANQ